MYITLFRYFFMVIVMKEDGTDIAQKSYSLNTVTNTSLLFAIAL